MSLIQISNYLYPALYHTHEDIFTFHSRKSSGGSFVILLLFLRGGERNSSRGSSPAKSFYLYGDDVAGAVDHRQALVHEQLPHVLDVPLVGSAERLPLGALQHPDRLQGSRQDHRGQGGGEDEAGCKGAHRVHQGVAAGDVASNTAKSFAWNSNR